MPPMHHTVMLMMYLLLQITEAQIPAAAATCKAALDAAVITVTAANGDFTGVTQPTGATLANNE